MTNRWSITEKGQEYVGKLTGISNSDKSISESQHIRWAILNYLLEEGMDSSIDSESLNRLASTYSPMYSSKDFWREFAWLSRQGYIGDYGEINKESNLVKSQINSLPVLRLTQGDMLQKFYGSDGYSKQGLSPEIREMEYHPEEMTDEEMN
jgi:hypothetical protein